MTDSFATDGVKPWDIFNKNKERVAELEYEKRISTCRKCPRFVKLTKQCKECGCFMESKAKIKEASCPLDKWEPIEIPLDRELTDEDIKRIRNEIK